MNNNLKTVSAKNKHNALLRNNNIDAKKTMNTPMIARMLREKLRNSKLMNNAHS